MSLSFKRHEAHVCRFMVNIPQECVENYVKYMQPPQETNFTKLSPKAFKTRKEEIKKKEKKSAQISIYAISQPPSRAATHLRDLGTSMDLSLSRQRSCCSY